MRPQLVSVLLLLVLAGSIAAGSNSRRELLQNSKRRTRRVAPDIPGERSSRNKDGKVFDFTPFGGAVAFLARLEPGAVAKLMAFYGPDKGLSSLANQLDADRDFVSGSEASYLQLAGWLEVWQKGVESPSITCINDQTAAAASTAEQYCAVYITGTATSSKHCCQQTFTALQPPYYLLFFDTTFEPFAPGH
jgi:hypothetical protein